jgi:hypothetical protein
MNRTRSLPRVLEPLGVASLGLATTDAGRSHGTICPSGSGAELSPGSRPRDRRLQADRYVAFSRPLLRLANRLAPVAFNSSVN